MDSLRCHQKPTFEKYQMLVYSLSDFLNIMDEEGNINEDHFDVCGIRLDVYVNRNNVFATASIVQEIYQRSKFLTH
jgi:hypothetical protein